MSIKVDLRDKYDRKALTFINGFHRYGLISIKKSFVDRRRKYSSTVTGPLKPKYTRPFKKARAKAEFNDFFALESNETKLSGRSWTTYAHDISSHATPTKKLNLRFFGYFLLNYGVHRGLGEKGER